MIELDMRTLWAWMVISESVFGLLLVIVWSLRRSEQALVYWAAASASLSLGSLGLSLRGQIPDVLSIPAANVLIGLALTLRWAGLRRFADQELRPAQYLAVPILIGTCFQFRDWLGLDTRSRVAVVAVGGGAYAMLMLMDLIRAQREERLAMRRVCIGISGLTVAFEVAMALHNALGSPTQLFLSQNEANSTLLLVFLNVFALFDLACFLMVFERHENRLVRDARVDSLTNVFNRSGFNDLANRQLRRSFGDARPVSVLVMDLDFFKKVNDTYGHEAGDAVLRAFAQAARITLRPTDLLARAGGEEFWVLLRQTGLEEASRIAQRVCDHFRGVRITIDSHVIAATVSIGAAEVRLPEETVQSALSRADAALFKAKRGGRDRVVAAQTTPTTPHPVLS